MVYSFDFIDFAERVAGTYTVKDVWGDEHDIRDIELILTESMLKLWNAYPSCRAYMDNCIENGYTIGVPKVCPETLENERNLNYQFIQSYDLEDEDIEELIKPTVDEIRDVLGGDWRKTLLYLRGTEMNENNASKIVNGDYTYALMADKRMIEDPYVVSSVYNMIRKRIDDAKVGVLKVHGNYSMASGDPYSLCQSIFGMPVTGILKTGEIYNRYWDDDGAEEVVCFRAPMSTHENIRKVIVNRSDSARYWFRYMNTCTILNSWDSITAAMNGMD